MHLILSGLLGLALLGAGPAFAGEADVVEVKATQASDGTWRFDVAVLHADAGEVAEVILNQLYRNTQMQTVFGINIVAQINNQPKLFNLKELLEEFIRHRREVVTAGAK